MTKCRLVRLDVEDCFEELLRQQSYHSGVFCVPKPLVGEWGLWMPELVLYGIRLLAQATL